jgi:hypothetical protein
MILACMVLAMLAWQRAARPIGAVALGVVCALATSLHYYAFLVLVPIAAAELGTALTKRQWRPGVWLALAAGTLPLALFWPLLRAARETYALHFWAPSRYSQVLSSHDRILNLTEWVGAALAVAISASLVGLLVRDWRLARTNSRAAEIVLALALINAPLVAVMASKMSGGGFTARYALVAGIGVATGIALLAHRAGRPWQFFLAGVLLLAFAFREAEYWRDRRPVESPTTTVDVTVLDAMRREARTPDLPVVVSHGMQFVAMSYYTQASELTYLTDNAAAVRHAGTDSVEIAVQKVARLLGLRVERRETFIAAHDKWLLYSAPDRYDWLYAALQADGLQIMPVAVSRMPGLQRILYLVEMRAGRGR